jgi:hypothetical protein
MPKNSRKPPTRRGRKPPTQIAMRVPRGPSVSTIYKFRRSTSALLGFNTDKGFTSSSGSVLYGNGMSLFFTLLDTWMTGSLGPQSSFAMPSVSEFVALFDRYRITDVNVKLVPSINTLNAFSTAIGTAPNTGLPIVQTAIDYDDATPPSSAGDLLQRADLRILRMDREHNLHVKPRFDAAIDSATGVTTGSSQTGWLATAGSGQNAKHFGRKFWAEPLTGGPGVQQGSFVMYIEYIMEFDVPR